MAGIHTILAADLAASAFDTAEASSPAETCTHTAAATAASTATAAVWSIGPTIERVEQDGGGSEHEVRRGELYLRVSAPAGTTISPAIEDTLLIGGHTYAIHEVLETNAAYARCRVMTAARTRLAGPQSRIAGPK